MSYDFDSGFRRGYCKCLIDFINMFHCESYQRGASFTIFDLLKQSGYLNKYNFYKIFELFWNYREDLMEIGTLKTGTCIPNLNKKGKK